MKHRLLLLFLLSLPMFFAFACGDDDDDDSSPTPSDDDTSIDDDQIDDDNTDDDATDDDATDDDIAPESPPLFVRPDLPLNVYHIGASHNTYIWLGYQGVTSVVASQGAINALDKGQIFLELDVSSATEDGDFVLNHSGATGSVRLSSVFRNIRWWSDIHPGHQPIAIGFEWNAGYEQEKMDNLHALVEEFLIDPSPASDIGPLYSYDEWLNGLLAELDEATRNEVLALTPREATRVIGFPSYEQLRGRIILETDNTLFATQNAFFLMSGDGQIDNNSEDSLSDLNLLSANRTEQRLTRIYPSGNRIFSNNYDIFIGMGNGVSNCAQNMEWTTYDSADIFVFQDEFARGLAPAGKIATNESVPARMGPPVFVTALSTPESSEMEMTVSFDESLGIDDAPVIVFHVVIQGLSFGEVGQVTLDNPAAVVLTDSAHVARVVTFTLPAGTEQVGLNIALSDDAEGYEIHIVGPTVADVAMETSASKRSGSVWISPTYTPINLTPTEACVTLGPQGERLYGEWDGLSCNASDNPSFMVEMAF